MATKIHHLNPIPGSRELFTILEVINNKKEYEKALEELETKRKEVNDLIDVVGDAEEIKSLHEKAKAEADRAEQYTGQKISQANKEFAEAHEQAEKLVNDAREKSEAIIDNAKKIESDLAVRVDDFNRTSAKLKQELDERQAVINAKENELRQREGKANEVMSQGTKLKTLYEEKIEKIRKLQGEL